MDINSEFLNCIYQNTKMGTETINAILPKIGNEKLRSDLVSQMEEYDRLSGEARKKLSEMGEEAKEAGILKKGGATMGAKMNIAVDASDTHVAEMMINGSTMGIIEATRNLKKYVGARPDVYSLGNEVLEAEKNNLERIKAYL